MNKIRYFLLLVTCLVLYSVSADELGDFYPGRLNICFAASAIRSNTGGVEIYKENGIIKTQFDWFNDLSTEFEIVELKKLYNVKNTTWNKDGKYPMNVFNLEILVHSRTDDLLERFHSIPEILFAEYDPILRQSYTPNDPLLQNQWAMRAIEAERAWTFETGSEDVIIGIVDSGVKWNHVDLAANIWTNIGAHPGITLDWSTGQIIGGNGTEIVIGWDFAKGNDWWELEEGNNPFQKHPSNEHGTHVSGCAAAVGDNGIGVVAPAYTSKIMATKHSYTSAATNSIFNGYAGIYFCADNGAKIINCSWGGTSGEEVANLAATYAKDHGALLVVSAGNSNRDNTYASQYPANARDAFSVSATDINDLKASWSSYGENVGISSPGVGILATFYGSNEEDTYASLQGTSMAAPVVAGVAALILSYYPDLTVDELIHRLEMGADPIDHLNQPHLAGKLGAGRVNAFNSLMFDKLPRVEFDSIEQIELSGDDNTLNPGERLSFKINLKNRENWRTGLASTASITTTNPHIQIINSTVSYGQIPNGQICSSENSFIIYVSEDIPIETHAEFIMVYHADAGMGITYDFEIPFTIVVSRNKDGWPLNTLVANAVSCIVFDLNQNGENEIIFLDTNNKVHAMNSQQVYLEGFPVTLDGTISNSLTIIKSGIEYEILVTGRQTLYKINKLGKITAERTVEGTMMSTAVAFDINNDGYEEVAIGTTRGFLYLFENDLSDRDGFPKELGSNIVAQTLFVDFNKDGSIDILCSTLSRNIHIFTVIDGVEHNNSPIYTNINLLSGLVGVENDHEVYLYAMGSATGDDNFALIDYHGNRRASRVSSISTMLPIAADLNRSGDLDIISVTNSGHLFVFDSMLRIRNGFPVILGDMVSQHPILVDIDNDGTQEILVLVNNGTIYAIKYDGSIAPGFPFTFNGSWRAAPILADIDGSDRINLLVSNVFNLTYLDLPTKYSGSEYPMHAYSRTRNAVYNTNIVSGLDKEIVNSKSRLVGNYPNPFNPETKISFTVSNEIKAYNSMSIDIFNIKGQKIQTLPISERNVTNGYVIWTAENFASGIYFYRLMIDNKSHDVRKALLLK